MHESEKSQLHPALDSNTKANGATHGTTSVPESKTHCLGREYSEDGSSFYRLERSGKMVGIVLASLLLLNLIFAILIGFLSVRLCGKCPPSQTFHPESCPEGWIGYNRKCYYFSMAEGNWTSSRRHCSSYNASLAVVDSQEELDFFLRYKSPPDHWIGLYRDPGQPWKWINESEFNGWFLINGGGRCAYMNHHVVASSSCTREEHWICSKPSEIHHSTNLTACIN